ncbi:PREDICTED: leucine-rich repeat-containing protein 49-like isoform X3 [Branchiostoma belcheri]|uniref:Leucine-rich repeat-containing protein 49-like isoform X3 n=1 Tax=Branchiostoma belcheri TaxID=7741 RepID=A0A6P4ZB28_BRABE|nr:PREDICTED: leucine-rich repeat-containing protein 49-like isoform X3 [Branchiostoma belcheri]
MYHPNKLRNRSVLATRDVSNFGLSVQAAGSGPNEKQGHRQGADFRLVREAPSAHTYRATDLVQPAHLNQRPGASEDLISDLVSPGAARGTTPPLQKDQRGNRQVHTPSTAYVSELGFNSAPQRNQHHQQQQQQQQQQDPMKDEMSSHNARHTQSAGALSSRQQKGNYLPGDRVIFAESPSAPGIPIVYRTQEERASNPDRLNLDRRRLTVCPILEGEEHLRLLNLQHNLISKIQHLSNLRRLIFLDLYDNQIEEITGLAALKSLRVLMLGKNRIKKIANLDNLQKLDVLDLHGNLINKIENLQHLSELRVLNLAGNSIIHVENLSGMDSLAELNLRRNQIVNVTEVDTLPSLQRLFLSFNNISSFDDIACLGESASLSEVSLDGNPLAQEAFYKQTILKHMVQLRQLDMRRISEEERRIAAVMARKEEEKKRETNKMAVIKEKRRLAINNAARNWEAHQSATLSKIGRFQPSQKDVARKRGSQPEDEENRNLPPNWQDTSSKSSQDSLSGDAWVPGEGAEGRGERATSQSSFRSESQTSVRSTDRPRSPDSISNDIGQSHLAELEGEVLHLYGAGALDSLDRNWGIQAAGSVTSVSFHFIDFDYISRQLHKIRNRFPNVQTLIFNETNIRNLQQFNTLASLRRLDNLSVVPEGNPVTQFTLWKPYVLFRLAHFSLRKINDTEVTAADMVNAEKMFGTLSHITTSQLPQSRLLTLLGETRRKKLGMVNERFRKSEGEDGKSERASESVGRAGLQYMCEDLAKDKLKEQTARTKFSHAYIKELTKEATIGNKKQQAVQQVWQYLFREMVHKFIHDMRDSHTYMRELMEDFEGKKQS